MASELSVRILLDIQCEETASGLGEDAAYNAQITKTWEFSTGTTADLADMAVAVHPNISASSSTALSLNGSNNWPVPLVDEDFSETLDMLEGVAVFAVNKSLESITNDCDITLGAGSNPWVAFLGSSDVTVGPIAADGMLLIISPDATGLGAITATSADNLTITTGTGTASDVQFGVVGRSA